MFWECAREEGSSSDDDEDDYDSGSGAGPDDEPEPIAEAPAGHDSVEDMQAILGEFTAQASLQNAPAEVVEVPDTPTMGEAAVPEVMDAGAPDSSTMQEAAVPDEMDAGVPNSSTKGEAAVAKVMDAGAPDSSGQTAKDTFKDEAFSTSSL